MIRRQGSPYEVRCPRCDVSFPVETRRCVHCGGPTAASEAPLPGAVDPVATSPWIRSSGGDVGGMGSTGSAGSPGAEGVSGTQGGEASEVAAEAPPSFGAALLRSFGSLIWVVALIAFSILRSCGED